MDRTRFTKISARLAPFAASTAGNVTVLFSLALFVMMGIAGAAIDYVRVIEQRTVYAAAADAAVLAAISSAREAERNGLSGIPALAEKAAASAWNKNIETSTLPDKSGPKIKVKRNGKAWTATVDYKDRSPTTFVSLLGIKYMNLEGTATASTTISKETVYWDFHIVVDDSSSMGIGATQADMDALAVQQKAKLNIDNCTFACHSADYSKGEIDGVSVAKSAGIKLRIDVVDDAVDAMVNEMTSSATDNNVRAKLWGLNNTVSSLVDLTTKLADVKNHNIQLYKTPVSVGNTDYQTSLAKLTAEVDKAGDGKSAVSPKKAVFIVTDGIHDTAYSTSNVSYVWWSDHQMGTVDPAFCKTMKDRNVLVGVLFIDYIIPAGHDGVMTPVTPYVLPALKDCASEGLFFNATSPEGITKAMKEMLAAAMGLGTVRLTD